MLTIMLVDDDPTMLRLLKTLLEIEGFRAVTWNGDKDLLHQFQIENPDMILLDVNLRGLNGLDVLKSIRADTRFSSTPVIMTSGMDYSRESLEAGANRFLIKPYMPESLIASLKEFSREK